MTLGLTRSQLKFITACAQPLAVEKRSVFLRRLVAFLKVRDRLRNPSDDDLEAAVRAALGGLVHEPAA